MDIEELRKLKEQAVERLNKAITAEIKALCDHIDARLSIYLNGVAKSPETHNIWEYASCLKFVRQLKCYYFDIEKVQAVFRAIEGVWENGKYKTGGFLLDSNRGRAHYRLTPIQVYIYCAIYGFYHYVDLGEYDGETELLPSECVAPNGHLYDLRRLCSEALLFVARKNAKTDLASNIALIDFFFQDLDSQAMLCANSQEQSKIVFKMIRDKLMQLDPKGKRIRMTAKEISWKTGEHRKGEIFALSAGAKSKDGLKASLVIADEYGSASYTNGRSDMADLVQVGRSSQGPRREPLFVITTTAGNSGQNGPLYKYLEGVKLFLTEEMQKEI